MEADGCWAARRTVHASAGGRLSGMPLLYVYVKLGTRFSGVSVGKMFCCSSVLT